MNNTNDETMSTKKQTEQLFQKKYLWIIGAVALLYISVTVIVSKFYVTVQYIPYFMNTLNWAQLLLSVAFTITIGILLGVNILFTYLIYKNYRKLRKEATCEMNLTGLGTTASVTGLGALGGVATGVCSACVVSVFPWLFGLFGVTISFGALPFQGLEIQFGIVALLLLNGYYLHKKITKGGDYG